MLMIHRLANDPSCNIECSNDIELLLLSFLDLFLHLVLSSFLLSILIITHARTATKHRNNTMHTSIFPHDLTQPIPLRIPIRRGCTDQPRTILLHQNNCCSILVWSIATLSRGVTGGTAEGLEALECGRDDGVDLIVDFGGVVLDIGQDGPDR